MSNRSCWKKQAYEELSRELGWSEVKGQPLTLEKPVELPRNPEYSFEIGHVYQIRPKSSNEKGGLEIDSKFRYEGKQGKHHCFRETRGGWSKTYTDAQLTEKEIKEE